MTAKVAGICTMVFTSLRASTLDLCYGGAPQLGLAECTSSRWAAIPHEHPNVSYPQVPPVGGEHWPPRTAEGPGWQRCGGCTEPVVDEFAVHSVEHGAVWLTYRPGAAPADVQALAALTAVNAAYVLVSPVRGQAQPFMATVWGLQLGADSATDPRLRTFTQTYAGGGQGDEPGADCANGSTREQALAALSRVAASAAAGSQTRGPGATPG